jgi:hypothetical protein
MKYKKFELTVGKQSKNTYKYIFQRITLDDIINDVNFINYSHLVYGASQSGKTLFTTLIIRTLIEKNPGKFGLIILSKTEDVYLKFSLLDRIFKNEHFDRNRIIRYDNLADFIKFYKRLCEETKKKIESFINKSEEQKNEENIDDLKVENEENKNIPPISYNEACKNLSKPTHYIIFFDDCAEMFKSRKNQEFFDKFFPNKRHSNITVIYGTQVVQYILPSIKNNTDSVTIIGEMPHTDCNIIYTGFRQISKYFDSLNKFSKFIDIKNEIFKDYAVYMFKNVRTKEKPILYHLVSEKVVKLFEEYECDLKNN